jgi:hypothetical protein
MGSLGNLFSDGQWWLWCDGDVMFLPHPEILGGELAWRSNLVLGAVLPKHVGLMYSYNEKHYIAMKFMCAHDLTWRSHNIASLKLAMRFL